MFPGHYASDTPSTAVLHACTNLDFARRTATGTVATETLQLMKGRLCMMKSLVLVRNEVGTSGPRLA